MIYLGENIKKLRKAESITQKAFAEYLGINNTTLNNYESGVSRPDFEILFKISQRFKISVDELLFEKGKVIETEKTPILEAKGKVIGKPIGKVIPNSALPATSLNPVKTAFKSEPTPAYRQYPTIVTVSNSGTDNILYVPVRAQAGYLLGYQDAEYIEQLPAFHMPGLNHGTYRMFEVSGISMSPTISHQDRVICEYVSSLSNLRENRIYVVLHKEGIAIKRVLNRITQRGKIYLKSDTLTHRSDYPILELDPADIIECWYVHYNLTTNLQEPSDIYSRLSELEIQMHEVNKTLKGTAG